MESQVVQGLVASPAFLVWGQELRQHLPLGMTEPPVYSSHSLNSEASAERSGRCGTLVCTLLFVTEIHELTSPSRPFLRYLI